MAEQHAGALTDLPAGSCKLVEIGGTPVVLARVGDRVYACASSCSHQGGPLGEGMLKGTRLTCPWHGWMYDVRSGQCLLPARGAAIATYPVRVESGEIWVDMP